MRELINKFDKELVYDYYSEIIDEPKPYKKITRYKMLEEIQDYFVKRPERAINFLLLENYKQFKQIAESSTPLVKAENTEIFSDKNLEDMFYLEDIEMVDGELYYELLPKIKETLNNIENDEALILKKEAESIALGFIEVHGYINLFDLNDYVEEILEMDLEHDVYDSFVISRLIIKGYHYSEDEYYIYHPYFIYSEEDTLPSPRIYYDKKMYIEFANYGAPKFAIKAYKEIYPYLDSMNDFDFLATIVHGEVQNQYDPFMYLQNLLETEEDKNIIALNLNWPIWNWGGMSFLIYYETFEEESLKVSREFIENVQSTIIFSLEYNGYDVINDNITKNDLIRSLQNLFSNENAKDTLLEFLPTQDAESIRAFKNAIVIEDGILWNLNEGVAMIYHENRMYHVQAFNQLIEDRIDSSNVPSYVDGVLLPLDNGITFIDDFIIDNVYVELDTDMINVTKKILNYHDLFETDLH